MALLAVMLLAIITVPLLGGRLRALEEVRLRWGWAIAVAIGLQILIISIIPGYMTAWHPAIHVLSYVFAAIFIAANWKIPGVAIIGLGAALNSAAIIANGGVMPSTVEAMSSAGIVQEAGDFVNSTAVEDPQLLFLGDIFAIPKSVPYLDTTFSIGDVLIAAGVFVLIHALCGSRLLPERWRRPAVA